MITEILSYLKLDASIIDQIWIGSLETLYMTLGATFLGYVFGLPMGVILAITDKQGLRPSRSVYHALDVFTNITRSIPFLILLILVIPITKFIVGKSYGSTATLFL